MINCLKGRRLTVLVTAAVTAVVAGGVGAYAAIPDATGTISGCYTVATGALRVVDNPYAASTPTCASTEKPLTWAQRGPTGPIGPRGPAGPVNQHWVKISNTNTLIAASEKPDATYFNIPSGYAYVRFVGVDPTKCAITVVPSAVGTSSYPGLFAGYSVYSGYILAYLKDASGNFAPNVGMDITANCTQYTPYTP